MQIPLVSADTACPDGTTFCGKPVKEVLEEDVAGKVPGISETSSLTLLILGWISFALPYAGLLAFVGILYAGFLYVTGFADEGNISKAKNIMMWSIVGLIIIFSAYVIVATFINPTAN